MKTGNWQHWLGKFLRTTSLVLSGTTVAASGNEDRQNYCLKIYLFLPHIRNLTSDSQPKVQGNCIGGFNLLALTSVEN
ncbi:MAG: hypothetical protein F6J96_05750 [Symploca sp. SIO1C2]|nr:hypothetical protein [Symploca sp. SIO1C2]